MLEFVNLMEGVPIKLKPENERMDAFWKSDEWVLEPIEKGKRYQCLITDIIEFSSSKQDSHPKSIQDKIPYIIEELKKLPKNSLLDGYITCYDYEKTLQVLETNIEGSLELQKQSGKLNFVIMDVIYLNGKTIFDLPLFDRRKFVEKIKGNYLKPIDNFFNTKYEIYEKIKNSYDAFYFKSLDSVYFFRKSRKWRVLKELKTYFCIILDIIEGKGKYKNVCGSLEVGQFKNCKLTKITNISGMNMDDRILFFEEKKKFINKIIEIKVLKKTENNFIEAIFSKLRNDKTQEDCVFE